MTKTFSEALFELSVPFERKQVKFRDAGHGKRVAYADVRTYINRLDEVFGGLWQDTITIAENGVAICSIGLKAGEEWIWRSDGAGQTNIEGEKGGISDAFKRACVKWGLGRYLYYLPDNAEQNFPEWATPSGYRQAKGMNEDD